MQNSHKGPHLSVMVSEILAAFAPVKLKVFFDGTLGAGGHAAHILETHPEIERYIGCDRDPLALREARKRLEPWAKKVEFVHGNFADLDKHLGQRSIKTVDGFFLI